MVTRGNPLLRPVFEREKDHQEGKGFLGEIVTVIYPEPVIPVMDCSKCILLFVRTLADCDDEGRKELSVSSGFSSFWVSYSVSEPNSGFSSRNAFFREECAIMLPWNDAWHSPVGRPTIVGSI